LKSLKFLNNEDDYLFYRMFSYKRHLQEITNLQALNNKPVKMLKRIMQTADIISPAIEPEMYSEISQTVKENLANRDVQLLNEYSNICTNLILISEHPDLFLKLNHDGKIQTMYDTMTDSLYELRVRNNVSAGSIYTLRNFQKDDLRKMLELKTAGDTTDFSKNILIKKFDGINKIINSEIVSQMQDREKLESYVKYFEKIYTDAGYHRVTICWLDKNLMGVVKDDFTKNIKDLKVFAKENNLTDVDYKLVDKIPQISIRYGVWARYSPSETENKNYKTLRQNLLNDKKNFNIKRGIVF